jgi:hypothetical protein
MTRWNNLPEWLRWLVYPIGLILSWVGSFYAVTILNYGFAGDVPFAVEL